MGREDMRRIRVEAFETMRGKRARESVPEGGNCVETLGRCSAEEKERERGEETWLADGTEVIVGERGRKRHTRRAGNGAPG